MAYGAPGIESFKRAIPKSRNQFIFGLLLTMKLFREEIISNDDLADRGGTDSTTKNHFLVHLMNIDRFRRRITYNPNKADIGEIVADGVDVGRKINSGVNPFAGDAVQGQSGAEFDLRIHFDGTDENFPPISKINLSSPLGNMLLSTVDDLMTQTTRLESRHRTKFLTQMDSIRTYQILQQIHESLVAFAGDENRVDVTNPLPSDEPLGADTSPNRIVNPK